MQGPIRIVAYSSGDYEAYGYPAQPILTGAQRCAVCNRTIGPGNEVAAGFLVTLPKDGQVAVCLDDASVREPQEAEDELP